ncbi:MAG: tRNA lysidine(34) synthetase TilS [Deltaproteobacteria bacterium]|nr:tRNA lysidine(34) synthetase TilS [Deltaproteobacteria bacterium]
MTSRKHTLQARVLEHCRITGAFDGCKRALVAVSGGADSMVLLDCLNTGRSALGLEIVVAHVDHGLRETSDSDRRFVLKKAAEWGLEAVFRKVDVASVSKARKLSIEDAARRVRYAAFAEMAAETGADLIATGHTATDQAETVLMRMIRGTGPLGLGGIAPARPDGLVRPLLCATRNEVRRYADRHSIEFRDDPTNLDRRFLRNRVRLDLLPMLTRMNPRVEFTLSELAGSAGDLASWIERLAAGMIRLKDSGELGIEASDLNTCDAALLPYVILLAFKGVTGAPLGLSRTHIDSIIRMIRTKGGNKEYHLPRGVTVCRNADGLWFLKDTTLKGRRGSMSQNR